MPPKRIKQGCLGCGGLLLLVVVIALGIALYQGRQTPTGRPDYVALGSSFAAGAGLGSLQSGSPWLCARSINGYPQQLARLRGLAIVDMSCGGAVTGNVLHGGQFFQGPQIRTITPATRLVTITVGGNDVGYIGDLSMLAARHTDTLFGRMVRWWWGGPKLVEQRGFDTLHTELLATVRAIQVAAPGARIVLATYPTILPPNGTCSVIGLTADEASTMRQVGDRLAAVTGIVARESGTALVDMHALGASHNACSPTPWTRGWSNGGIAPFHPTLEGATATAAAISVALNAGAKR